MNFDPRFSDEFSKIRRAREQIATADTQPDGGALPAFVGQVTSSGGAIAVGRYLMVTPVSILGNDVEGGSATVMTEGQCAVPVFLAGPGLPATGDYAICRFVDHRWVAERTGKAGQGGGGGGMIPYPGCYCDIPPSLKMVSADPKCNFQMFQSCTISYGTPPASLAALGLGPKAWLSTQSFPDPIAGVNFFYYFGCNDNQFYITRMYATSPYGSPYRDAALYTWLIGSYGNACNPFQLLNGSPYLGSQTTCSVTIKDATL